MSITQAPSHKLMTCPDCRVKPGSYHRHCCDVECCPRCGRQFRMCLKTGFCPGSMRHEPWPPPLDDRMAWTGSLPGADDCARLGWYARENPNGHGWLPCGPDDPGAQPDLNRLCADADWDRLEKQYVVTNLTVAFSAMGRAGIIGLRGREYCRSDSFLAIEHKLTRSSANETGFAYYTAKAVWRMMRGKDFAVHFGTIDAPEEGSLPELVAVGKIVNGCLNEHGVKTLWNCDSARPIRVLTASIVTLPGANEQVSTMAGTTSVQG